MEFDVKTIGELKKAITFIPDDVPLLITGCYGAEVDECKILMNTDGKLEFRTQLMTG